MKKIQKQVRKTLQGDRQKQSTQGKSTKPKKNPISKFFKKNYITIYITLTLLLIIVCIFYIYKLNQESQNIESPTDPQVVPSTETPPPKPPIPDPTAPPPPPLDTQTTNIYLILCITFMVLCFGISSVALFMAGVEARKASSKTEEISIDDIKRQQQQQVNPVEIQMMPFGSLQSTSQVDSKQRVVDPSQGEAAISVQGEASPPRSIFPRFVSVLILIAYIVLAFLESQLDKKKQTPEALVTTFKITSFVFLFLYILASISMKNACKLTSITGTRNAKSTKFNCKVDLKFPSQGQQSMSNG